MEKKLNSAKYTIFLLEKLNKETLLLNRIIYKTKNQFRRQANFKLINKLKKLLFDSILIEFKANYVSEIKDDFEEFYDLTQKILATKFYGTENLIVLNNTLEKIGKTIQEMLKLKLYVSYSLLILGIVSRMRFIVDNLLMAKKDVLEFLDEFAFVKEKKMLEDF